MAFLNSAAADTVRVTVTETPSGQSELDLEIGALPEGYELVAGPERSVAGRVDASLGVGGSATTEGSGVGVSLENPLIGSAAYETFTAVDINGTPGWIGGRRGHVVTWQIDERTFVMIAGNDSRAAALELARAVRFVDEETWRSRYDVAEPQFPTEPRELTDAPSSEGTIATLPAIDEQTTPASDEPSSSTIGE